MNDTMLWIVIGMLFWISGICVGFSRRAYRRKFRPGEWNQRHIGLIAFTDIQSRWMIVFWPVTWLVATIFIMSIWISNLVYRFKNLVANFKK